VKDLADANGKTVSSYVQDVTGRMGGAPASFGGVAPSVSMASSDVAALQNMHAKVLARADALATTDPAMSKALKSAENEKYAAAMMDLKSYQAARQEARDSALDEYIKMKGDPKVNSAEVVARVKADNRLGPHEREHLIDAFAASPEQKGDGPAFTKTFLAINAPSTDPVQIRDKGTLLSLTSSGQLTYQGFTKLSKVFDDRHSPTGGGDGVAALHTDLMKAAQQVITPKEFMMGAASLPEMQNMASFHDMYLEAYAKGIDNDYTPQDMLTPKGKHSLYPLIEQFAFNAGKPNQMGVAINSPAVTYEQAQSMYTSPATLYADLQAGRLNNLTTPQIQNIARQLGVKPRSGVEVPISK
jgi:hypothetical protein